MERSAQNWSQNCHNGVEHAGLDDVFTRGTTTAAPGL
jgi:hypothetical protein